MAAANFERALDLVLRHEGGYVDHPRDPGGATNRGITIATLSIWRGKKVTKQDVRDLSLAEAGEIYRAKYWDRVRGDDLPGGIDYCAFDAAVNSGPRRAIRWLQQAVFAAVDGELGPQTLSAVRSANVSWAIRRMARVRLDFLQRLTNWRTFGRGWQRRVDEMERDALRMTEGPATAPSAPETSETPLLRQGDSGEAVARMQALLADYGMHLKADGDFGPKTHIAVKLFQQDNGLTVDGKVGPQTWAALTE